MSGRALLAAVVTVAVAVGAALWKVGSPAAERQRRLDRERERDLKHLAQAVDTYVEEHGALPADLDALMRYRRSDVDRTDPETEASYAYRVLDVRAYELCATFARQRKGPDPSDRYARNDRLWHHPAGRHCYRLEVPPDDD